MKEVVHLGARLAPDTIAKLERAAQHRFATAEILQTKKRRLEALYLYGYSAEICLSAAYYRRSGLPANTAIDRDTRQRRMAQARQLRTATGEPLMNSDPHPLVGWARFLQWERTLRGGLTQNDERRLREAINKATLIYTYWRPELRYKTVEVPDQPLQEVRRAAQWLLDNQKQL